MQHVNVGAAGLEYERHGSGEPILLIHGVLVGDLLRPLANEDSLAGRYELIAYHRRGFADSDAVTPPFGIGDQAADAPALLRALGVERVHVVAHSYGAAIALQLAVDAPDSVHTLTLLEAPSVVVPSAEQVVEAAGLMGERFASGDKEGATNDFLAAMGGAGYREPLDRLLPGAFEQAVADSGALFTVELPALGAWSITQADARRIDAPVLRVVGDDTIPWFVESDALLAEWLPNSERSAILGAGHFSPIEKPQRVAETLATFIARHPMS
jgi:pimeloyl-ACP methyl ester carboxylesterase